MGESFWEVAPYSAGVKVLLNPNKKLEQEQTHHIDERPIFNMFLNFYWLSIQNVQTYYGDQTIIHCYNIGGLILLGKSRFAYFP